MNFLATFFFWGTGSFAVRRFCSLEIRVPINGAAASRFSELLDLLIAAAADLSPGVPL